MSLVIDASSVVALLLNVSAHETLADRLRRDGPLHAPHLIDLEVLQSLRKHLHVGALTDRRASAALDRFSELPLLRYPHWEYRRRIWALRHNMTAYDATYVALSEVLDAPLLTADRKLARTTGHSARVELFP